MCQRNQRPVDSIFTTRCIFQSTLAVVQLTYLRKSGSNSRQVIREIAIFFCSFASQGSMKELGNIAGVFFLGVVIIVIISTVEKQTNMEAMATLKILLPPITIDQLTKSIFLCGLHLIISNHLGDITRQTPFRGEPWRRPNSCL